MEIEDTVLFEILIFENYNEADSRQDDGREKDERWRRMESFKAICTRENEMMYGTAQDCRASVVEAEARQYRYTMPCETSRVILLTN